MALECVDWCGGHSYCMHGTDEAIYLSFLSPWVLTHSQRLTIPVVDSFIADLKDSVKEALIQPSGKGTMVAVYGEFSSWFIVGNGEMLIPFIGLGTSSAVGPSMVRQLATMFLDATLKA